MKALPFCSLASLFVLAISLLTITPSVQAEANRDKPPYSLTLEQVESWSITSKLADKNNIAKVSLQPRFVAQLNEKKLFYQ